jgi:hypothetical protein
VAFIALEVDMGDLNKANKVTTDKEIAEMEWGTNGDRAALRGTTTRGEIDHLLRATRRAALINGKSVCNGPESQRTDVAGD